MRLEYAGPGAGGLSKTTATVAGLMVIGWNFALWILGCSSCRTFRVQPLVQGSVCHRVCGSGGLR